MCNGSSAFGKSVTPGRTMTGSVAGSSVFFSPFTTCRIGPDSFQKNPKQPAPADKAYFSPHFLVDDLRGRLHPSTPSFGGTGRYRSGQTGRTVNPLAYAFSGSNPLLPILCTAKLLPSLWMRTLIRLPCALALRYSVAYAKAFCRASGVARGSSTPAHSLSKC